VTDHSTRPAATRHTYCNLASVNTFAILKIYRCRVFVVNRCFCGRLEFQTGYSVSTENSPSFLSEMVSKSTLIFKYEYCSSEPIVYMFKTVILFWFCDAIIGIHTWVRIPELQNVSVRNATPPPLTAWSFFANCQTTCIVRLK